MQRIPEPELMDDEAQARAYSQADFSEPHDTFVQLFRQAFPQPLGTAEVLDLGCGPADVTARFAKAFPDCRIHGVDGARAMLHLARERVADAGLEERVTLTQVCLPTTTLPQRHYTVVISNSLLHHLQDPMVLWATIRECAVSGTRVFVMDLRRPDTVKNVMALVAQYAGDEPEVLRQDFYNSLLAAYEPAEVEAQLAAMGLPELKVNVVSDRHLTVSGILT